MHVTMHGISKPCDTEVLFTFGPSKWVCMVSVALSLGLGIAPVYLAAVSGSPFSYKLLHMRCSDFPPRLRMAVTCPSEQAENARKKRFCQSVYMV